MFCVFQNTFSQDTTIQLVSKMDVLPGYTLWDGSQTRLMGYTQLLGSPIDLPSPTIIVTEGDSVELKLRNFSQPAPHTIHLHGLDVDQQNDGVPHLSFQVNHGENKSYFFRAPHPGTYLYHCHVFSSLHVQGGMYGLLIVKPSQPNITWTGGYPYEKEYAWLTSEIDSNWHTMAVINQPYDSTVMSYAIPDFDPQYFLINGKSETQLDLTNAGVEAAANEEVYLRLANIGFYGNRYVFPDNLNARIISSDGRPLPAIENSDTLFVYPGERYGVLFNSSVEFTDSILVDYLNMNTQLSKSQQKVPVDISGFASILNLEKESLLRIYPNPSQNYVNIEISDKFDNFIVELIAVDGRKLNQFEFEEPYGQFEIDNLPKGYYIVRVKIDQRHVISKILIKE